MTPLVLNRHCCGHPPGSAYIGRPSVWANPFTIGRHGTRAEVIAKYEAWLRHQYDLLGRLDELRGKHLVCFCAPAACHGDLLLHLANTTREERIAWWRQKATPEEIASVRSAGRHALSQTDRGGERG